jgi:hypothetical protein
MSVLEASCLIHRLPAWRPNIRKGILGTGVKYSLSLLRRP